MAMIGSVSTTTSSFFHGGIITRVQHRNGLSSRNSSGLASLLSGAVKKPHKNVPILQRDCSGVDVEHIGCDWSGRNLAGCWKGWWTRKIPGAAELSVRGNWSAGVGGGQGRAVEEELRVMEGDVVEYPLAAGAAGAGEQEGNLDDGRRRGVGVIVDIFEDSDALLSQIEPLCQVDPGSKEWIQDELQPEITVPIGQLRVLQAWYSQRMVPDRISNPHGEHAENLWMLE